MIEFNNILAGERIELRRTMPNIQTAEILFKTIDKNREHLAPWLDRVNLTNTIEDELKYLFDKEEKVKIWDKIEYGIYLEDKYLGNINIFDINMTNKSAEIWYRLDKDFSQKGYMTEAVKILEKEAFENFKLNRIQIKCDERNIASAGVAKKCGYILEWKLRECVFVEYFDDLRSDLYFSKLKSEFKW